MALTKTLNAMPPSKLHARHRSSMHARSCARMHARTDSWQAKAELQRLHDKQAEDAILRKIEAGTEVQALRAELEKVGVRICAGRRARVWACTRVGGHPA